MQTDQLIQALARDTQAHTPRPARLLALTGAGAILAAALVFFSTLGVRADAGAMLGTLRFSFKFVVTVTLAVTAIGAFLALARPGARKRIALVALAAAPVLLLTAVLTEMFVLPEDLWATRWIGTNSMVCLTFIPLIGAIPLALFLWTMRSAAPTRPRLAGAVAGILAGATAATFYAAHCPDDSPFFVATWYTLAIAILALVGTMAGGRYLRW